MHLTIYFLEVRQSVSPPSKLQIFAGSNPAVSHEGVVNVVWFNSDLQFKNYPAAEI